MTDPPDSEVYAARHVQEAIWQLASTNAITGMVDQLVVVLLALARLYQIGAALDDVDPDDEAPVPTSVDDDLLDVMEARIDRVVEVLIQDSGASTQLTPELADPLIGHRFASIYRYVSTITSAYDSGKARDARWYFRFAFWMHAGEEVLRSMLVLSLLMDARQSPSS